MSDHVVELCQEPYAKTNTQHIVGRIDQVYSGKSEMNDDVSLTDLWFAIRKRRFWLLLGLLCGMFAGVVHIFTTTPIYESHASILIGRVYDKGLVEEPGSISVQLMAQYGPESDDGRQRDMPHLKQVSPASLKQASAPEILKLIAVAYSPDQARDFLTNILAALIQRHEQIYAGTIDPLRRRLTRTNDEIEIVAAQVKELGVLIGRLKETQPAQASLVAIERARLYVELGNLERDRTALQRQIINPYSNPSKIIAQPGLPEAPVAPKKSISIGVGMAFGLFVALLVVFFREFAKAPGKSGA